MMLIDTEKWQSGDSGTVCHWLADASSVPQIPGMARSPIETAATWMMNRELLDKGDAAGVVKDKLGSRCQSMVPQVR
jgi:hypothetical protein